MGWTTCLFVLLGKCTDDIDFYFRVPFEQRMGNPEKVSLL